MEREELRVSLGGNLKKPASPPPPQTQHVAQALGPSGNLLSPQITPCGPVLFQVPQAAPGVRAAGPTSSHQGPTPGDQCAVRGPAQRAVSESLGPGAPSTEGEWFYSPTPSPSVCIREDVGRTVCLTDPWDRRWAGGRGVRKAPRSLWSDLRKGVVQVLFSRWICPLVSPGARSFPGSPALARRC